MADTTCTRKLEWDAAHRVMRHESKCASLHGHRYVAEITCSAPQLDTVGRVIDFGQVKEIVGKWIDDNWDHTTMVHPDDHKLIDFVVAQNKRPVYVMTRGEPTAENIAAELLEISANLLPRTIRVEKVRIYETPNCYAEAYASTGPC